MLINQRRTFWNLHCNRDICRGSLTIFFAKFIVYLGENIFSPCPRIAYPHPIKCTKIAKCLHRCNTFDQLLSIQIISPLRPYILHTVLLNHIPGPSFPHSNRRWRKGCLVVTSGSTHTLGVFILKENIFKRMIKWDKLDCSPICIPIIN